MTPQPSPVSDRHSWRSFGAPRQSGVVQLVIVRRYYTLPWEVGAAAARDDVPAKSQISSDYCAQPLV